jgi:hypothetical protein
MPKLNTAALRRLIDERYGGVQQRFLNDFKLTRKAIGQWYADGLVTDKRLKELCDHFSVDRSELDLEALDIDMDTFMRIYEVLEKRAEEAGVSIPAKALIHWTGLNYRKFADSKGTVDVEVFDTFLETQKENKK